MFPALLDSASILMPEGASQVSSKCSHILNMLRFFISLRLAL
jgi:hypothetical protein